jgi:hypothetical protein
VKIKITYQVSDGYVSGSRPQHMEIETEDFEGCPDDDAIRDCLDDIVYEHMLQRVSSDVDDMDGVVARIREAIKEKAE